jgi:hypothetical protein
MSSTGKNSFPARISSTRPVSMVGPSSILRKKTSGEFEILYGLQPSYLIDGFNLKSMFCCRYFLGGKECVGHQCGGSGMFIPDPDFYPSRIPDLGSRIPDPGSKNSNKFHKIVHYFSFEVLKKKI